MRKPYLAQIRGLPLCTMVALRAACRDGGMPVDFTGHRQLRSATACGTGWETDPSDKLDLKKFPL